LFSQGDFGIVTEMTILLAQKPESVQAFVFELNQEQMKEVFPKIRSVLSRLESNIGGISVMNYRRALAVREIPYPAYVTPPGKIMSDEQL
jgi:hypothetical protein